MKKTKKKKKCKLKLNNLLILLSIITSGFLIYRISQLGPIEPFIRFTVVLLLLGIDFLFFYYKKSLKKVTALLGMIAFIGINLCITNFIGEAYASIDSMNKSKTVYSSSLITKKSSTIETIDDVTALKIGILNNTLSIDNYVIAREIVEEHSLEKDNELVEYEDVDVMLQDLYDEKIDAMLISSNYKEMFQTTEGFENVESEVKVIFAKDKTVEKNQVEAVDHNSSVEKPFTVLLMGVDSEKEGLKKNAYANGDALILITFNPETLNTTMMSIPRDSYLPIACKKNKKMKLTQAGWYGTDCMMDSIENAFDIDINYYVKINFKGVVGLVEALHGIDVEVPKRLCTDNSNREGEICIEKGWQTLNGEQALVFARNRYDLARGDIDRGYNQQTIVRAMITKLTSVRDVNTLLDLLDTVSNNLDTNLTTDEILSFYNIFKQIISSNSYQSDNVLNIKQLSLSGQGKMIYYDNLKMKLWNYVLDEKSVKEVTDEMKINLKLKEPEYIKTFHFEP